MFKWDNARAVERRSFLNCFSIRANEKITNVAPRKLCLQLDGLCKRYFFDLYYTFYRSFIDSTKASFNGTARELISFDVKLKLYLVYISNPFQV